VGNLRVSIIGRSWVVFRILLHVLLLRFRAGGVHGLFYFVGLKKKSILLTHCLMDEYSRHGLQRSVGVLYGLPGGKHNMAWHCFMSVLVVAGVGFSFDGA
jgi:hypothetical protein